MSTYSDQDKLFRREQLDRPKKIAIDSRFYLLPVANCSGQKELSYMLMADGGEFVTVGTRRELLEVAMLVRDWHGKLSALYVEHLWNIRR